MNDFKNLRTSKSDVNPIIFFAIALMGLLSLVFTIFYNEFLSRIISYGFFCFGYALYFYNLLNKKKISKNIVVSLLFLLYLLFIWIASGLNYKVLISCLSFFLIFSSFDFVSNIANKEYIYNFLLALFVIQALLFIYLKFTDFAYFSFLYRGTTASRDLLLGLSNPNETGIALVETIIILFVCIQRKESKFLKFLVYLIIGYLIYLLILTRSRTSFLGLILYFVLVVLNREKNNYLYRKPLLSNLIIIFSMSFPFVYMVLFKRFENVSSLFGKTIFSGRQNVFQQHIDLWTNKIFGNLDVFYMDNAHNGFLSILVNLGILGFVLYSIHLFLSINTIRNKYCGNAISRAGFIAVLCVYFMCCSESAFITSGHYYFSNFLIICWLATCKL